MKQMCKIVPNENSSKKDFVIKLGTWFLVSKGRAYGAIIL